MFAEIVYKRAGDLYRQAVLNMALTYAEKGWRVIPSHISQNGFCSCRRPDCKHPGKHPIGNAWQKRATTDPATIKKWWLENPWANVGIMAGGESGIFILDIDPRNSGHETLREWQQQYGTLPVTPTARTGGGGEHYFFQWEPGMKNDTNIGPGVDVKTDGGFVVAAPSIHPSGRQYEWDIISDYSTPVAKAPEWLIDRIKNTSGDIKKKAPKEIPSKIEEGARNNTLFHLACFLRGKGMGYAGILAALIEENNEKCEPPVDLGEVENIARSAMRYPPGEIPGVFASAKQDFATEIISENLTDLGNARRLVARYGKDIRYCHPWGRWLVWDGGRWAKDETGMVLQLAKERVRSIYAEAAVTADETARKAIADHARRSESAMRIRAMVSLAESEPGVPVLPNEMDRHEWLFNVKNGTIDLRTGELRPHRREDILTKIVPVEYDPVAECPTWLAFLERIMAGNRNLIGFLQRAAGYSLTASTQEQCFFLLHGTGANGKSVFLTTLLAATGDYGIQAAPVLLLKKSGESHPTEVADLFGARLVVATETEAGRRLAENLVKQLTGGDRLKARFMRQDFFEFNATHKIWLATNNKPTVRGTDYAIWRRIKLVPFTVTIPPEERDGSLPEKLRRELPGILAWAVKGCLEWQARGLDEPAEVTTATSAYRDEQDALGGFIRDRCVVQPCAKVSAMGLYRAYVEWCGENGEHPMAQRNFGMRLTERGFQRKAGTGGYSFWHGLGLRTFQ
jgi:putative DNA primase/helicase